MAGAGFKTFNTGDVLTASDVNTYLMQQTVMVFADATARSTALGANVAEGMLSYLKDTNAVEVYDGSNWVSSDDPNAIQNTIVDAKGDIITATAADTPARLAVGTSGNTLVADSSATTGLAYVPTFFAGKNKIINGDCSIWQRGTSFSNPASDSYTMDRMVHYYDGSGATRTISRQAFTPGTAPVSGYEGQYFFRYNQSVAGTGGTYNQLDNVIENVQTLAGQTATLSFWGKADANRNVSVTIRQGFGSGGSPSGNVDTSAGTAALTTSWQRFTFTISIPSISGKTLGTNNNSNLRIYWSLPLNTAFTFDMWGLQLEAGSTATQFQTATGTIQGELAACQRYYWRIGQNTDAYSAYSLGFASSTTNAFFVIPHPVNMRVKPTSLDYSTLLLQDGTTGLSVSSAALSQQNEKFSEITTTVTGATAFRPYRLINNNSTNGYIGFNAEL